MLIISYRFPLVTCKYFSVIQTIITSFAPLSHIATAENANFSNYPNRGSADVRQIVYDTQSPSKTVRCGG